MSSVYALDACKQYPTFKFWTFLISRGPRPLHQAAHALNKGTKRRTAATYFAAWVGHTHLKILQTMLKTRPHQESFEKCRIGGNFLPDHTVLLGWRAQSRPLFFKTSLSMYRIICTISQCSRMSRNALKTG